MKNIRKTLSLIWLLPVWAIFSSHAYSAAIILNGDFEGGVIEPWYQGIGTLDYSHDEFWNISTSQSYTGVYSVTNVGNNELRQDFTPVASSKITQVSFYLLKDAYAVNSAIQLHYSDNSWDQILISSTGINVWEFMDVTGSLDQDKSLSGISFFGIRSDPGIRLYLDDINIILIL